MINKLSACLGAGVVLVLAVGQAAAQHAGPYAPPRLADGHPDLQGLWTNTSLTVLERPKDVSKLVLSEQEAASAAERRNQSSA